MPVARKLTVDTGESETPGGAMPVPLSAMVWVRYWSETVRVPAAGPMVVGANATAIEQVECALSELPQVLIDGEVAGGDLRGDEGERDVAGSW